MAQHSFWREGTCKNKAGIIGENEFLRVEIVPERGSKWVSFLNKQTGKEWCYQNDEAWNPLQYGMNWGDADRSGWDEMFPTVLSCPCPDSPWQHAIYPDHGEVWALPWQYEILGDRLRMWVHGVQVPYILEKTCLIQGQELQIDFQVENPTPFPFSYMWAAHYLLNAEPGMELVTEPQLQTVQYYYSHGDRVAKFNDRVDYPFVNTGNEPVNLSLLEPKLDQFAEKYWFDGALEKGMAGIKAANGETLTYLFSPEDVPYLAVWANYGGFWKQYNFAFEPATGYLDNVYIASAMNKVKKVDGYSKNKWRFTVSLDPKAQHE